MTRRSSRPSVLPLFALCLLSAVGLLRAEEPARPAGALPSFHELLQRQAQLTANRLVEQASSPAPLTRLSFDPTECRHFDLIQSKLELNAAQREHFQQQGFVSLAKPGHISFGTAYDQIYHKDLPVLITSDSILHVLHRSFDNTLRTLEEQGFIPLIDDVLRECHHELARRSISDTDPLSANYRDVDLYLTVSRSLLRGQQVSPVFPQDEAVRQLLTAIASLHLQNPLQREFTPLYAGHRAIDYSQFKPRGHYTQTSALQNYFRCLMWLGRADTGFFVTPVSPESGIVNQPRRELRDAALLADLLTTTKQMERLRLFDRCLEFLVGVSDNLDPPTLAKLMTDERLMLADLARDDGLQRLETAVANARTATQRINSQTIIGSKIPGVEISPPGLFQMLGQRFVVDSYVLSKVVYDSVPRWRLMPSGLDVAAALGNRDALPLLSRELQQWEYAPQLAAAREFTAAYLTRSEQPSVTDLWLASLTTLHQDVSQEKFFPQSMRMPAWRHKQLHTQLASWAELRHDTILFVKQSYTKLPECDYPSGFVEPYPAFFERTRRMAEAMVETLADLEKNGRLPVANALAQARRHWHATAMILEKLEGLARKELAGEPFSIDEQAFLKQTIEIRRKSLDVCGKGSGPVTETFTGWYADLLFPDAAAWTKPSPTIADVHTNPKTAEALEVGVGDVHLAVLAVDHGPDRLAFVGPIYSYYEFTQPASDRLTNEQFAARLGSGQAPPRPHWIKTFEP